MGTDIKELHEWLKGLNAIPVKPEWKRTFMDITGITRLENRWSDIYCYFFNQEENHGLKDLFIRSLEQVVAGIPEKWMGSFSISREWEVDEPNPDPKSKSKRIDLLIQDEGQHRAIIIENKVNHVLNNDLELYYKAVEKEGYADIKGIVLSLHKLQVPKPQRDKYKYKCITHKQLLDKVKNNLPAYFNDADPQSLLLLQDFIQNAINMTNEMDEKEIKFFLENYTKVSQIHRIYQSVTDGYKKRFDEINPIQDLEKKTTNKPFVYWIYKDSDWVSLTLLYERERLWEKPDQHKVTIVLELQGKIKEAVDNWERSHNEALQRIIDQYSSSCNISPELAQKNKWRHYASVDIVFSREELFKPEEVIKRLSEEISNETPIYKLGKAIIDLYK